MIVDCVYRHLFSDSGGIVLEFLGSLGIVN